MIRDILSPFEKFVKVKSLSGILLLIATILALIWANSPLGDGYRSLWEYKIGFTSEDFSLNKPLILWINDGLMAIFFFTVGLEIKREVLVGELDSTKKVAFPLFAALGGILLPVSLFLTLNQNPGTVNGWGIPMATDIAFSLAILNLLRNRVPLSLKIFLTAFAIVDDIGAVLVIAVFYSGDIHGYLLGGALLLLAILYFLSFKGYYSKYILLIIGVSVWTLFLKSGIHPTVAGVLLAFSVPVKQKISTSVFTARLRHLTTRIRLAKKSEEPILSDEQISHVGDLEDWSDHYQSPLQQLEQTLNNWVSYFIIPVFALANAGVLIEGGSDLNLPLVVNLIICLVVGKSIGISTIVFLVKRLNLIRVSDDINTRHIIGISFLAGIGFTMALFIANLAFAQDPVYRDSAKFGILIGSFVSAIIGFCILRWGSNKAAKGS